MPSVEDIATTLNGYSSTDRNDFNQICETALYEVSCDEVGQTIQDTCNDVEGLNAADYTSLQGLIEGEWRIGDRPC